MGQLCTTRPNPTHQTLDPTEPHPLYKVILIQPTHGNKARCIWHDSWKTVLHH